MTCAVLLAALAVGSWNLKWFPSGRAEHRASERVERANLMDAAETIAAHLRPHGVFCAQELRDPETASNLVYALQRDHPGASNLTVAATSAFRTWDKRLEWQQCAILTDLPVLDAGWSYWKRKGKLLPPRGYAYAIVDAGADGLAACFCVHLKSNYGATSPEVRAANAEKRELCAEQLVAAAKRISKLPDGRPVRRVVIVGDFNADFFSDEFKDEKTAALLLAAGFRNGWEGVPRTERGTHPGNYRYPDSTLDHVFHRGFSAVRRRTLAPAVPISDHRLLVFELE